MALVIRLRQQGRVNDRSFRLVITDKRSPRDGKYIENLGWYNPYLEGEKGYLIKGERVEHWLNLGAELSPKAQTLIARAEPELIKKWKQKSIERTIKLNKKRKK